MKVRNKFGEIIEVSDLPQFKSLLKSLGLTPVSGGVPGVTLVETPPMATPIEDNTSEVKKIIPIFESLLNQVPDDLTSPDEVAVFVMDIPGFENFTETDAEDFLLYRQEKKG